MIQNKYLKEWIILNYPLMEFDDDTDVCELDYLDMDRFADWVEKKITMSAVSERSELFIELLKYAMPTNYTDKAIKNIVAQFIDSKNRG